MGVRSWEPEDVSQAVSTERWWTKMKVDCRKGIQGTQKLPFVFYALFCGDTRCSASICSMRMGSQPRRQAKRCCKVLQSVAFR